MAAASDFLILPLPDDGGGLPSGGGAMPAGVSGCGDAMCNTNSFGFFTPFPFPLPVPYGACLAVRAFTAFPDVASCFAPIPDGTVPEELAGACPVSHLFQPS